MTDSNTIPLVEDTVSNFPTGSYRVGKLRNGTLYMASLDVTEEQTQRLAQLDASEIYDHQSGKTLSSEADEFEEVSNGNAGDYAEYSDSEQDDIDDGEPLPDPSGDNEDVRPFDLEAEPLPDPSGDNEDVHPSDLEAGVSRVHVVTQLFFGVPHVSQKGLRPVLLYKVPGQQLCYSFAFHRASRASPHSAVYRCIGCRKVNQTYTKITVLRDIEFDGDPCRLAHVCLPKRWLRERSRRNCQEWRFNEMFSEAMPSTLHHNLLRDVMRNTRLSEEAKDDILRYFHDHEKFRRTIERSIGRHRDRTVTMMCVPDSLAYTGDGRFLHVQSQDMHIYYNESAIRLAYMNGLEALVADGMFSKHPDGKQKNGQLYTIHSVCNGKVNVPLLFALTNKKAEAIYFIIWSTLKGVLDRVAQRNDYTFRVVANFEKASINSLRRDTWLTGPFADLWNKWQVIVLRTTNIAENFHSKLSKATNFRKPTLQKLIEILHGCTAEGSTSGTASQAQGLSTSTQRLRDDGQFRAAYAGTFGDNI
ncbi:unnamed protein product [Heligmosomoides polygyrus]|uniref:MULE domain-containing protein n=1 Tax=Heligmosomoides polygyrus TaxID=6339 RepID=A0A183G174_HELPZ|nr:unnamed protein product [Heligmosomoides polygyrus]